MLLIGNSSKGPEKDYSLKGDTENRLFGIFNALSIIATTYGNGIIPEIQVQMSSIISHLKDIYKDTMIDELYDYQTN